MLKSENATLEILKRKASITGTGTQTYGGEKGKFDWKETKQENIAQGNTVFIPLPSNPAVRIRTIRKAGIRLTLEPMRTLFPLIV